MRPMGVLIHACAVVCCLAIVGEAVLSSQLPQRMSGSRPLLRLKGGFFGKNGAKDDAKTKKDPSENVTLVERRGSRQMQLLRTSSYSTLNEQQVTDTGEY
jgi:hypothetical protein